MQNYIKIKGKIFKAQLFWRNNKNDNTKDDDDKLFPFPKNSKKWTMADDFLERLKKIQNLIETKKPENQIFYEDKNKNKDCLLCDKKKVCSKFYFLNKYLWEDSMIHYIKYHNSKPNDEFINFIFDINLDDYFIVKLAGRIEEKQESSNISYLKLDKNQIMILDALMKHGGYTKKYYDINNKNLSRYSEHAGFLETNNKIVYDIIVSGNTFRVDKGDEEIFLPGDMPDSFKYHYIFHTHPPTPKPGGRATDGIIYEFPSVGDILHFVDHFNMGKTIGSLVMTPEGMYNIRKINLDSDKIKINENKLYKEMRKEIWDINQDAIKKYGKKFSTYDFYSKIAQDTKYIDMINEKLKKYFLHIDFFPRISDFRGKWIVDTIYIPLYNK
jgi:hypothetical protein